MRLDPEPRVELRQRAPERTDVSAWLLTLKKVLRLPEGEAAAILDELEDHLDQRVRDLQLSGLRDSEAVRLALNELGDAAVLARRFRSANSYKRRRLAMNLAVLGVACGAAVLSVFSVARGPQAAQSGDRERISAAANAYLDLAGTPPAARMNFVQSAEQHLGDLLESMAKTLELPLHVRWARLDQWGIQPDTGVVVIGKDLDVADIFRRINEAEAFETMKLDFRVERGVLEVADREFFDRRERMLASYDITQLLAGSTGEVRGEIVEDMTGTIMEFVSPEDWRDNGGELGVLSVVDTKLFVEAPPRMHRQVAWILEQLNAGGAPQKEAVAAARGGDSLEAHIASVRKNVALQKLMLGRDVTEQETAALGDSQIKVKVMRADDPRRAEAEQALRAMEEFLKDFESAPPTPEASDTPEEHSSRSYPIREFDSMRVLQTLIEIWGPSRLDRPIQMRTDREAGDLTISGPTADVAKLDGLLSFLTQSPPAAP